MYSMVGKDKILISKNLCTSKHQTRM